MSAEPLPLVLDTDIGDDIDDAWALSVCINHPAIRLVGVTTVWRDTELRAAQARLLLERAGVADVPVAAGARDGLDRLLEFHRNCQADVLSAEDEARLRRGRVDAVRMLAELAEANPGLVVAPVGPLTNVARFICEYPKAFAKISRLVIMGGHMRPDLPHPEYNVGCDVRASQIVFSCGKPIQMIGLDVTLRCQMQPGDLESIEAKRTPLSEAIMAMTRLWQGAGDGQRKRGMPVVHDPLAVLTAVDPELVKWETRRVVIDDRGNCVACDCGGQIQVAVDVEPDAVRRRVVELIG